MEEIKVKEDEFYIPKNVTEIESNLKTIIKESLEHNLEIIIRAVGQIIKSTGIYKGEDSDKTALNVKELRKIRVAILLNFRRVLAAFRGKTEPYLDQISMFQHGLEFVDFSKGVTLSDAINFAEQASDKELLKFNEQRHNFLLSNTLDMFARFTKELNKSIFMTDFNVARSELSKSKLKILEGVLDYKEAINERETYIAELNLMKQLLKKKDEELAKVKESAFKELSKLKQEKLQRDNGRVLYPTIATELKESLDSTTLTLVKKKIEALEFYYREKLKRLEDELQAAKTKLKNQVNLELGARETWTDELVKKLFEIENNSVFKIWSAICKHSGNKWFHPVFLDRRCNSNNGYVSIDYTSIDTIIPKLVEITSKSNPNAYDFLGKDAAIFISHLKEMYHRELSQLEEGLNKKRIINSKISTIQEDDSLSPVFQLKNENIALTIDLENLHSEVIGLRRSQNLIESQNKIIMEFLQSFLNVTDPREKSTIMRFQNALNSNKIDLPDLLSTLKEKNTEAILKLAIMSSGFNIQINKQTCIERKYFQNSNQFEVHLIDVAVQADKQISKSNWKTVKKSFISTSSPRRPIQRIQENKDSFEKSTTLREHSPKSRTKEILPFQKINDANEEHEDACNDISLMFINEQDESLDSKSIGCAALMNTNSPLHKVVVTQSNRTSLKRGSQLMNLFSMKVGGETVNTNILTEVASTTNKGDLIKCIEKANSRTTTHMNMSNSSNDKLKFLSRDRREESTSSAQIRTNSLFLGFSKDRYARSSSKKRRRADSTKSWMNQKSYKKNEDEVAGVYLKQFGNQLRAKFKGRNVHERLYQDGFVKDTVLGKAQELFGGVKSAKWLKTLENQGLVLCRFCSNFRLG